jgi:hypothetical protein
MVDEAVGGQTGNPGNGPVPTPVKVAWKTTEFWLNTFTVVVGAAMTINSLIHPNPNDKITQILGVAAMLLGATGHTVSRTIIKTSAQILLVGALALAIGCSAIDAKTLADFQTGEALILKDMAKYVAADVAAGKTPVIGQAAIDAHAAKIKADPRSVDPAEEQAMMAQFQAYVASDPKLSAGTIRAWNGEVSGHLTLFTSVHR